MNQIIPRKYWPYDEVTILRDTSLLNRFKFESPWLTHQFSVDPSLQDRVYNIVAKIQNSEVLAEDLDDVSWLMETVKSYPLAYILPRLEIAGRDQHIVIGQKLNQTSPSEMLIDLLDKSENHSDLIDIAQKLKSNSWTWDVLAVQEFSQSANGYDPESVFSVARRFHLLNDIENNKTKDLFSFLSQSDKNSDTFKFNNAVVIRQNHHITKVCEPVLSASLKTAQNARHAVLEFVDAEAGHDKILEVALKSMGKTPEEIPVLSCVTILMELFQAIAEKNFLAFAMVIDVFERSSYLDQDPLAVVLKDGGLNKAASQLNTHRDINEKGGHENVALEFLNSMAPINADYLIEALRLSELLTLVIHMVSKDTLELIQKK
jgi:hypothetical protein